MLNKKNKKKRVTNNQPLETQNVNNLNEQAVVLPEYTVQEEPIIMSKLNKTLLTYGCNDDLSYIKYFIQNTPEGFQPIIEKLDIKTNEMINTVIDTAHTILNNANVPLDFVEVETTYEGVSNNADDVEVTLL